MSLLRNVLLKNLKDYIIDDIISDLCEVIVDIEYLLTHFYSIKMEKNKYITFNTYKYFLLDKIYPKCLQNVIINSYTINSIRNAINYIISDRNIFLLYFINYFQNNIIISYYLKIIDDDNLHFVIAV
jgi:hypothetical protein